MGESSFPHPGQWDLVFTNSSPRGTRKITTFKKEYTLAPKKNKKMLIKILNHSGKIILILLHHSSYFIRKIVAARFPLYIFSGASNPKTEIQSSMTSLVRASSAIQPAFFTGSSSVRILVS